MNDDQRKRLCAEIVDLGGRLGKLATFSLTQPFRDLPPIEQDDLFEQMVAMTAYLRVLVRRAARHGVPA